MVQNKHFDLQVKTKDNVFTTLHVGVQLRINPEDTERAFFSLEDADAQV
jgi:regulator of protease activity HflC (stomatin/prohibitin superfamily)